MTSTVFVFDMPAVHATNHHQSFAWQSDESHSARIGFPRESVPLLSTYSWQSEPCGVLGWISSVLPSSPVESYRIESLHWDCCSLVCAHGKKRTSRGCSRDRMSSWRRRLPPRGLGSCWRRSCDVSQTRESTCEGCAWFSGWRFRTGRCGHCRERSPVRWWSLRWREAVGPFLLDMSSASFEAYLGLLPRIKSNSFKNQ